MARGEQLGSKFFDFFAINQTERRLHYVNRSNVLPMKNLSTPEAGYAEQPRESRRAVAPAKKTIAFLKQFARTYVAGPNSALPGFVMN